MEQAMVDKLVVKRVGDLAVELDNNSVVLKAGLLVLDEVAVLVEVLASMSVVGKG